MNILVIISTLLIIKSLIMLIFCESTNSHPYNTAARKKCWFLAETTLMNLSELII